MRSRADEDIDGINRSRGAVSIHQKPYGNDVHHAGEPGTQHPNGTVISLKDAAWAPPTAYMQLPQYHFRIIRDNFW